MTLSTIKGRTKVAVIHFQPLEWYPPVMNDINELLQEPKVDLTIFSTFSADNWFSVKSNARIYRYGCIDKERAVSRYLTYVLFNLYTIFRLLINRPDYILAYESLSIYPVYMINKVFRNIKTHIHFHEYISVSEIKASSFYFKYLISLEKKLISKNKCSVSHTNEDRGMLFKLDNELLDEGKLYIFPNYPPINWLYQTNKVREEKVSYGVKRLIHIGAIGLQSSYLSKFIFWFENQDNKYNIDFYLSNIDSETQDFLRSKVAKNPNIRIFPRIKYYDLPSLLVNYDIGLVLYNGYIPNHVYSVPNKVVEYLACGLDVWYSDKLVSTTKFIKQYNLSSCHTIDFENICINENADSPKINKDSALFKDLSKSKIKKMLYDKA